MKYFIDFEASQYTQEIISIGCVSETGETFYSLVNTKHPVGKFVSSLTGLNQNDVRTAPIPDVVFTAFYQWINKTNPSKRPVSFICYGNADTGFALNTLKHIKLSYDAQCILSLIALNLTDYSETVKQAFGLTKHISLIKVAQYYSNNADLVQTHNALDDAKMLKYVYDSLQNNMPINIAAFPEYMSQVERYNSNNEFEEVFYGMEPAIHWLINHQGMSKDTKISTVATRIKNSSDQKKPYCGFYWVIKN